VLYYVRFVRRILRPYLFNTLANNARSTRMYVSLLRVYLEVSQQSPLLYLGLIILLMASWGLIVSAIVDIAIRLFDMSMYD